MPINLLKLPFLIQEEIFRHTKCSHLFILSLCSLRIKKSIERVKFNYPKLRYYFGEDEYIVRIIHSINSSETIITVYKYSSSWQHLCRCKRGKWRIGENYELETRYFLWDGNYDTIHFCFGVLQIDEAMLKAFQDHINSIFGYTSSNQIDIDIEQWSYNLPKIQNVEDSILSGSKVEVKVIEQFFEMHPNHKSAHIIVPINVALSENSRIMQIPFLYVKDGFNSSLLVKMFKGKRFLIDGAIIDTSQIVEFLTKWASNEAYQNFEMLEIHFAEESSISMEEIHNISVIEKFDQKNALERPDNYFYHLKVLLFEPAIYDLRDDKHFKVTRKSDGKTAYVYCEGNLFQFFVSHE